MRDERQASSAAVVLGIIATLLLHGGVFGFFWISRSRANAAPPLGPGTFVDAQLVKFGKPRDLSFLPHKQGQVKTQGPPQGLKIATSDKALPHLDKKEEPPDKIDPLKKTHAEQFKNIPDQPEGFEDTGEGSPTGSRSGTATSASGDPFIQDIMRVVGEAWTVPTTISDAQLKTLKASVCLKIDDSGRLVHYEFAEHSTSSQFDSSLEATLGTIKTIAKPYGKYAQAALDGSLCPNFYKR